MKINLISTICFLFCLNLSFSQAPEIEWQITIRGNADDYFKSFKQSSDGGFIIAGTSWSDNDLDKSEPKNASDYWVIKLNANGDIIWENTIGGYSEDALEIALPTPDGGCILGGHSISDIGIDKTENKIGNWDYWIVKIDNNGLVEWDKTIGGSAADDLLTMDLTFDGGYILGGTSLSGISGDKTEAKIGLNDIWVVKIDSIGNILWQNTIGGNKGDYLYEIEQTDDYGYILAALSSSNNSSDKSENDMGAGDYWVIKLNEYGTIEWENSIGGNAEETVQSVEQTYDGGYIIGGYSRSGISFDKSSPSFGGSDYWVLKLDSDGEIIWQNSFGGLDYDLLFSVKETESNEIIVAGYSFSNISGNKTENVCGGADLWILKLNPDGILIWQKDFGGNLSDWGASSNVDVEQSMDGGYIIGCNSTSDISCDKSEISFVEDFWCFKLETECDMLTAYSDIDNDGFGDPNFSVFGCFPFEGLVLNDDDCDDSNINIYPGSPELCNSLDDNCNGLIDDGITETISITAGGPITFCQGGNVLLTATYSGATVQWKKNGTNIPGATTATYNVTTKGNYSCVTTSACDTAESTPIFVNVIKNPNGSISAGGPTTFCAGGSVILTEVAVAGCTYQWYKGASPIAGATSLTYTATTSGNYKCRVTKAATGCFKNSNAIAVSVPCKEGLPDGEVGEMLENEIIVYPNPATTSLTISTNNITSKTILITDALGQILYTSKSDENIININIENLAAGMYFLKIEEGSTIYTGNFIKQ